jgi:uncharacterized membrane protein
MQKVTVWHNLKKYLFAGLAILLPLVLTLWIVSFLFDFLTNPFLGIAKTFLSSVGMQDVSFLFFTPEETLLNLSRVIVVLFLFCFICLIGAIGRHFFFRYLVKLADSVLHKIPLLSSVYKTSQELIQTVFSSENRAFKQVVMVPFPHEDSYTLGLVARGEEHSPDRVPVFVPTTPNPTSGYLLLYEKSKVIPLDLSVEDALRYIISCGVLLKGEGLLKPLTDTAKENT